MLTFTGLVRDLFSLANDHLATGRAGDGRGFERRVERRFAELGIRPAQAFSGVRLLGSHSLSGLYHQIDATGRTREAVVIGEWKAYQGAIPKNEVLRFKAVTDDYWLRQHSYATKPVFRIFGGTGSVSPALRRYAAQWGICLITPDRWPAPVLAAETTIWPETAPDRVTRRYLAWLSRPIGSVLAPQPDGGWLIPKLPTSAMIDHFLAIHDGWSAELSRRRDGKPSSLEQPRRGSTFPSVLP